MSLNLEPSSNWRRRQKMRGEGKLVNSPKKGEKISKKSQAYSNSLLNVRLQHVVDQSQRPAVSMLKQEHNFSCANLLEFNDQQLFYLTQGIPSWKNQISSDSDAGRFLAIDGEFVGVGPNGETSALARISVIDYHGNIVLDTYVRPDAFVTDWRTRISGVESKHLRKAIPFEECRQKLVELFKGHIIVGHALKNDFEVSNIIHPQEDMRDTQKHGAFKVFTNTKTPSLRVLCKSVLGITIQEGSHSSVIDAQAAMLLFRLNRAQFEGAFGLKGDRKLSRQSRKKLHGSRNR
jgi:RNA exonuclease 4